MSNTQHNENFDQVKATKSRKKGFMAMAAVIMIAGASYSAYWYFIGSRYISTDNAYAAVEVASVTPAVGGIVSSVRVIDTQYVKKGDVLVVIDNTDAKISLSQAQADYALAKRRIHSYLANDEGLDALVNARKADEKRTKAQLESAQASYKRAKIDLERRNDLIRSGSVSGEELTNAKTAFTQAQANLNVAKAAVNQSIANRLSTIGDQKANAALIENTSVEDNPQVLLAKARLDQAEIDLERTIIRAPVNGVIAKRQVQVGHRVQIGSVLMTVVPISNMHVDANFKEVELRGVKIGQEVELTSDLYGDDVVYHGIISGFSGGTGSAFSLIPAQNATGNWIKVVQRLPVRIELDTKELQKYPLQVGLSMQVTIDTKTLAKKEVLAKYSMTDKSDQG